MKIHWEEIYNNSDIKSCSFFEATYRAKVIGGWLIRHETCCDHQYENTSDELIPGSLVRYIHDEGYQDVKNVITFIPDANHKWDEFDNPMLGVI